MLKRHFEQVWNQLRAKRPQFRDYLERMRLDGIRGIRDLQVVFQYPVTVIAGPNACGKTTVLFAAACAYKREGPSPGRYPSEVFPGFHTSRSDWPEDRIDMAALDFNYVRDGNPARMRWAHGKKWNRSFFGETRGTQPVRPVYLRTLANLANPSEVRRFLQMGRGSLMNTPVNAELLAFAHRILLFRYSQVSCFAMTAGDRDLLFVIREGQDGPSYSELQMSAGERGVLRLSRDISALHGALVLIDEVEAGLHPFTQQQLMLELQRLALRNDLQLIVTTHSLAVLESVPPEARVFLERTEDTVIVRPPHRDVLQRALYGRPLDRLFVLCEDDVAEAVVRGVYDVLAPRLDLTGSDIEVGRDTGASEFQGHVKGLAMFKQLENLVVVLDGDARAEEVAVRQAAGTQQAQLRVLVLPGDTSPEAWTWDCIRRRIDHYAPVFGLTAPTLRTAFDRLEALFASAADKPRNIAKNRLHALATELGREVQAIARVVGTSESSLDDGGLVEFRGRLHDLIEAWRSS